MIPILIATSITCSDIDGLVERARNYPNVEQETRQEIIEIYQVDLVKTLGIECDWDANE